MIKSIVMIERGMIPPNAGFERLNPDIKADEWNLKVLLHLEQVYQETYHSRYLSSRKNLYHGLRMVFEEFLLTRLDLEVS